jgi:acyl-coenzyme A thioesterase PaaI-like protein
MAASAAIKDGLYTRIAWLRSLYFRRIRTVSDMTDPTQQILEATRNGAHPQCISCSPTNASGLALKFSVRDDKGVQAEFACSLLYQGYPGHLHGGISSLLLDSAMANCLFAHRIAAVTARLIVRFLLPVSIDQTAVVKAWIREYEPPLYVLEAELEQNGRTVVRASAKFINRDLI